jgi:hypothetical protein
MKKVLVVGFSFVFATTMGISAQCPKGGDLNLLVKDNLGNDMVLVVSDIPQKDVRRLRHESEKLMKASNRDLSKVEAYFKKKHLKTESVDASAFEERMKKCAKGPRPSL